MSKTKLKHASYSIKKLMDQSKLSFQTKRNYQDILNLCVRNMDEIGYQIDHINQLKQKHIRGLVEHWKKQALGVATIKNRMSVLAKACNLMNKQNVVLSNQHYDIGSRSYIPTDNKAIKNFDINQIQDPYIACSLQLQTFFGLRREESIKFKVAYADQGNEITLKSSWTKGGIARSIPITTEEQRACLKTVSQLCGERSLIPDGKKFIEQRDLYDRLTHQAGLYNLHGLRHAYAQHRYLVLTNELTDNPGWKSPIDGGKQRNQLTENEREIDFKAREIISRELGHSRVAITKVYLG